MAILSPKAPRKWSASAIPGVAALCFLAGCMIADSLTSPAPRFAFDHGVHAPLGLECGDCHARVEDSDEPGMPRAAQCAICHAELDAQKPPEERVATLFDENGYKAAHSGRQSDEIVFSHQQHATGGLDCAACHADVLGGGAVAATPGASAMSMDACIACHESTTGPKGSDCAGCHVEIRAGVAPPNHRANWKRYHGSVVRGRPTERSDQCALCHKPAECAMCHSVEMPENHNNFWRRRGHGITAAMDRDGCATCHQEDSCLRCHEETRPLSHTANWGAPRDRHCLGCHEPLRSQSCGVCHSGTPSHDQATPLPPDHSPAMNCRLCHGNGQALPHEDNGQSCTSCHH